MKAAAVERCRGMLRGGERLAGLYFDLHGAMSAEGCDDAEAEIVEAVRGAVPGGEHLAAASFDLHGNISERLCAALDLVATYKTMPHVDMEETKSKALRMLLACLQRAVQPTVVVVTIPAILHGETVLTTEGQGRLLYRWLRDLEPREWQTPELVEHLGPADESARWPAAGLLDASFFVGHGYADEPRVGAAVVLSGEASAAGALSGLAREIAQWYWDRRSSFTYPPGSPLVTWADAEAEVISSVAAGRRVLIGDLGDNTNAGASGDVPYVCRRLLQLASAAAWPSHARRPRILVAGLVDSAAVGACAAAVAEGRAALPALRIGAGEAIGASYGDGCGPLELRDARVRGLVNDGAWAVLDASAEVTVVLQRSAWAFFGRSDVERLTSRFRPAEYDVVVVKRGNVESLAQHVRAPGESPQRTVCLTAQTPGANAHPFPPRPRLRPGMWCPEDEGERTWSAPAGVYSTRDARVSVPHCPPPVWRALRTI